MAKLIPNDAKTIHCRFRDLNFKPQTKNTKWRHGPASFKPPRFPEALAGAGGLVPIKAVINIEVGEEVVLYLLVSNPLLGRLARIKELRLRLNYGRARNEFGPLGFLLFWVPYRNSPENALTIFDLYVNISNPGLMTVLTELAYQTHWHVFLLDDKGRQQNFWEFTNTFRLAAILQDITDSCKGVPLVDFDRAKEKFIAETTLETLHAMTSHSELNAEGKSVFDASNMVASPPEYPHPLKSARFAGIIRASLAQHAGGVSSAFDHERDKTAKLAADLSSKILIYLDVCHWINLRHVWLQSAKALPVYEKIVDRLNVLAQEQTVLCPLSTAIFDELMKQTDPLSRAATANLMDIFSQGICVRNFREAFCEQWKLYSSGQVKTGMRISGSVTKVGYWLSEKVLKSIFWSPETANAWGRVTVVRIPMKSDRCSDPYRTPVTIDVGQPSERSDARG